jgi:hypothetical protein
VTALAPLDTFPSQRRAGGGGKPATAVKGT